MNVMTNSQIKTSSQLFDEAYANVIRGMQNGRSFFAWLLQSISSLVKRLSSKFGVVAKLFRQTDSEADKTKKDIAATPGTQLQGLAGIGDLASGAAPVADTNIDNLSADLANPSQSSSGLGIEVIGWPEDVAAFHAEIMRFLEPVLENPAPYADYASKEKAMIGARALGEEAERMRYAQSLGARHIVLISQHMVKNDPKYYGSTPDAVVDLIGRSDMQFDEGSAESQLKAVMDADIAIRKSYDAHIAKAAFLITAFDEADAGPLQNTFLSGASYSNALLVQKDKQIRQSLASRNQAPFPTIAFDSMPVYEVDCIAAALEKVLSSTREKAVLASVHAGETEKSGSVKEIAESKEVADNTGMSAETSEVYKAYNMQSPAQKAAVSGAMANLTKTSAPPASASGFGNFSGFGSLSSLSQSDLQQDFGSDEDISNSDLIHS